MGDDEFAKMEARREGRRSTTAGINKIWREEAYERNLKRRRWFPPELPLEQSQLQESSLRPIRIQVNKAKNTSNGERRAGTNANDALTVHQYAKMKEVKRQRTTNSG